MSRNTDLENPNSYLTPQRKIQDQQYQAYSNQQSIQKNQNLENFDDNNSNYEKGCICRIAKIFVTFAFVISVLHLVNIILHELSIEGVLYSLLTISILILGNYSIYKQEIRSLQYFIWFFLGLIILKLLIFLATFNDQVKDQSYSTFQTQQENNIPGNKLKYTQDYDEIIKRSRYIIFGYCEVLKTIQLSGIFEDSKTFVDMPLKQSPEITYELFKQLPNHEKSTLKQFLEDNFYQVYSDVKQSKPNDFKENPSFLDKIKNEKVKQFSKNINSIWKYLVKEFDHSFSCEDCFTSIKSKYPFVVPGGRFSEYYYWDNTWIVHGLVVSEMLETANHVVQNLLEMIDDIGYMPNGSRIYYYNRTQPPFCTQMVQILYEGYLKNGEKAKAQQLIEQAYPILLKEYEFFEKNRSYSLEVDENTYLLNQYNSNLTSPRPESYREDNELHLKYPQRNAQNLYQNLGAGAESGWDYSSRWFKNKEEFGTIDMLNILPVDLNAIILKNEQILKKFSEILGKNTEYQYFQNQEQQRKQAMKKVFYNQKLNWADYHINEKQTQSEYYLANYVPLYTIDQDQEPEIIDAILIQLEQLIDKYEGGLPSSEFKSGQQWDFPNAWPPSQYLVLQGLWQQEKTNHKAKQLATLLSYNYFQNTFCAFYNKELNEGQSAMYEKYDSILIGQPGGAGEYPVQTGFGWSNGVLLRILEKYPDFEQPDCENNNKDNNSQNKKMNLQNE